MTPIAPLLHNIAVALVLALCAAAPARADALDSVLAEGVLRVAVV